MLEAVKQDGDALEFVKWQLDKDREVKEVATSNGWTAFYEDEYSSTESSLERQSLSLERQSDSDCC